MKRIALVIALAACSPALRATGRCPGFAPLFADFLIGGALLAASVWKYNEGERLLSAAAAAGAMGLFVGANLAESSCRR